MSHDSDEIETPDIDDETTFEIRDDVMTEEIEGEVVVLDLEGDVYFSMNEVGRRVWEAVQRGEAFAGIVDELSDEFDEVERGRIAEDARAFLGQALAEELMRVA